MKIRQLFIVILLTLPLNVFAVNFELDGNTGVQTSWPIAGQFGIGAALNFQLTSLVLFPYLSADFHGVEYLNKTVYFNEYNYGAGIKYLQNTLIYRATLGRMYRTYEGLADESYRAGIGFGSRIGRFETTLNYHYYLPLEKRSVVLIVGTVF